MDAAPRNALLADAQSGKALTVNRMFTQPGVHPFDSVEWELRDAVTESESSLAAAPN